MREEGFSDLHQHVLWGLDDGPQTPEQMRALLAQNVQSGISLLFATSHAYPKTRPFELALYRERLDEANAYCESQGWSLRVLPGCEIHYCDSVPDLLTAGKLPSLGNSRHVLIEFDHNAALSQIGEAADSLYRAMGNYLKKGRTQEAAALLAQYRSRMTPAQKKSFSGLFGSYGQTAAL